MNESLILVLLFCSSFLLTKIFCFLAVKKHWFDIPGSRSSHSIPTPKSGGVAFVLTYLSAVSYLFFCKELPQNDFFALLAGLIVAVLGLVDDFKNLSIKLRISVHFAMVLLALFFLGGPPEILFFSSHFMFQETGFLYLGYFIVALALVWLVNLYNFMDGIDGLAALEAFFVSIAASFLVWTQGANDTALLLLCLAVSVSGFMLLNLPSASIFMGDTGSNFLGFTIGVLACITINEGLLNVWVWGVLLGVFVVDGTVTLIERMRAGEVWYHPHCSHGYQKAAMKYGSHGKVDIGITLINFFWLFPLAWLSSQAAGWGVVITLLAYSPLVVMVKYYRKN